jgi:hypothetical protein
LESTSVGVARIQLRDGLEILLRDVPRSFAVACLYPQGNPGKALELGAQERLVVVQKCGCGRTVRELAARFPGFAGPAVE